MFVKDIVMDRKFLVTAGALLLSLLLFIYFPTTERLSVGVQSLIALFIFFFAFPLLYIRFILHESWQGMGFRLDGRLSDGMRVLCTVIFGSAVFIFGLEQWPALREVYQLPFSVERSFLSFVRYELFAFCVLFFYEVFFRGFVMLSFLRPFGSMAIFLQLIVFMLFLAASQSFGMNQAAMILFAPLSGWVAYRSQSIWYSFLASALFLFSIDVFLLLNNLR